MSYRYIAKYTWLMDEYFSVFFVTKSFSSNAVEVRNVYTNVVFNLEII